MSNTSIMNDMSTMNDTSLFNIYIGNIKLCSASSLVLTEDKPSNQSYRGYHAYVLDNAPELIKYYDGYRIFAECMVGNMLLYNNEWRSVLIADSTKYPSLVGHVRIFDRKLYLSGDNCTVKHEPSGFTTSLREYRDVKLSGQKQWLPQVQFILDNIILDKQGEVSTLDLYYLYKKKYLESKYYHLAVLLRNKYSKYKQKNKKKFVGIRLVKTEPCDYDWIKQVINNENKGLD